MNSRSIFPPFLPRSGRTVGSGSSARRSSRRLSIAAAWRLQGGLVIGFALLMAAIAFLRPASGEGFYAELSHNLMVALFAPAFLLPLVAVAIGLRRYWAETGAPRMAWSDVMAALKQAGQLKNLSGGQGGQGCNSSRKIAILTRGAGSIRR